MIGWEKLRVPFVRALLKQGCTILQQKEKFGELRIYWSAPEDMDPDLYGVLRLATDEVESISSSICIECGKSANLYTDGWILPLCDKHAEEQQRTTVGARSHMWSSMYALTDDELKVLETNGLALLSARQMNEYKLKT